MLIAAAGLWRYSPFPGALFLAAVAAYGAGRIALQRMREEQDRVGVIDIQLAICSCLLALSLISLLVLWLNQASPA